ncbi:MAG: radical SAM protein [Isosphaeraceae bacterium]
MSRRGPVLQAARGVDPSLGIYGLDLTAGCGHGCTYCYIRGTARYPGEGLMRFDPATQERLVAMLDSMPRPPRQVVMSPASDPLPPDRDVRAEALRVARTLLERGIPVSIMTRGRVGRRMIELLARYPKLARVAVGISTRSRELTWALEPNAAPPDVRLQGIPAD